MEERRDRRDRRNRGPRMTREEFERAAKDDLFTAKMAAIMRGVSLAQVELWQLAAHPAIGIDIKTHASQ